MLEKNVEARLKLQIERHGGLCIKLNPAGYKGIPDRLVILPHGRVIFVELKRPKGGVIAQLQAWWNKRLRKLGVGATVLHTLQDVDNFVWSALEPVDPDDAKD